MKLRTAGELVHLPARTAVSRYFDDRNYRVLRRLLFLVTPVAFVSAVAQMTAGRWWLAAAALPLIVGVAVWIAARSRSWFERGGPLLARMILGALVIAWALGYPEPRAGYVLAGFVAPVVLALFRLAAPDLLALVAVQAAAMGLTLFRPGMPDDVDLRLGMAIGSLAVSALTAGVGWQVTARGRDGFLVDWRREVALDRDRSRMRSELEDAREIQLSMLPPSAPKLDWADVSSVSLPASEVGGDYFDFFELSEARLAVVVADVAGHGVASGLVLSGVRSSLHLLRDELIHPVVVLDKLDRMLQETVGGRLFVTLQLAVIDRGRGRITVANAGHPPLFVVGGRGRVERLGAPSLPLGTRLAKNYTDEEAPLAGGERILMLSDGVPEVRNFRDDVFGERRVAEALRAASPGGGARQVRDSLLNAIARFKGDTAQHDDLTLVVVDLGPPGRFATSIAPPP